MLLTNDYSEYQRLDSIVEDMTTFFSKEKLQNTNNSELTEFEWDNAIKWAVIRFYNKSKYIPGIYHDEISRDQIGQEGHTFEQGLDYVYGFKKFDSSIP